MRVIKADIAPPLRPAVIPCPLGGMRGERKRMIVSLVFGGGGGGGGVENSLRRKMTNFFEVIAKSAVAALARRSLANIATYVAYRRLPSRNSSIQRRRSLSSSYRILNPGCTLLIRSPATTRSAHTNCRLSCPRRGQARVWPFTTEVSVEIQVLRYDCGFM